jgi:formate--tetrahydrofolate ligase
MKSDIEIASSVALRPISEIASDLGIPNEKWCQYGPNKAKVSYDLASSLPKNPNNKLVLVTAINPTPAGEGKTTTSIALADALNLSGESVSLALREPSLGPVFGIKGGAAGGGYAQVAPMKDINLHFTGDIHAITTANNLIAALIDNSVFHGNPLNIDPRRIVWKRCLDMNDRQLRFVVDGLGGKINGTPREDGFDISVASEIMAVFCLASDFEDLRERLENIIVAYTFEDLPVRMIDLGGVGSLLALLQEAFNPNIVQTLEGTPAFIHGGPFANIAHGCNSVIATRLSTKLSDWTVTEAGFGADLGAEKFFDIKCRVAGFEPAVTVLVATVRALKYNAGLAKNELHKPNLEALEQGSKNLLRHIKNLQNVFNQKVVVAINRFADDSDAELEFLESLCKYNGVRVACSEGFSRGGEGTQALAKEVIAAANTNVGAASISAPRGAASATSVAVSTSDATDAADAADGVEAGTVRTQALSFPYDLDQTIVQKIEAVATKVYGASGVELSVAAKKQLANLERDGFANLPVCIAKTQYSFSDDPKKLGAPEGFTLNVRELLVSAGAGFVVAVCGAIMRMPGLPKKPAAYEIDVKRDGEVVGLF